MQWRASTSAAISAFRAVQWTFKPIWASVVILPGKSSTSTLQWTTWVESARSRALLSVWSKYVFNFHLLHLQFHNLKFNCLFCWSKFQYTRYNANGIVKICTCVIRKATHGPFDQSDVWSNVPFLVPSLPPTDEGPDNLIQISYRIEVTNTLTFFFV